jgi:hypothetical protein
MRGQFGPICRHSEPPKGGTTNLSAATGSQTYSAVSERCFELDLDQGNLI